MDGDDVHVAAIAVLAVALICAIIIAVASNEPKFCPECGERWADNYECCPFDGTELLERRK